VKDPEVLTSLLADLGLLESSKIDDPTPEREILWHTVSGNPMRFRKGNIDIVADQQWRGKIDAKTFNIVTGMTLQHCYWNDTAVTAALQIRAQAPDRQVWCLSGRSVPKVPFMVLARESTI